MLKDFFEKLHIIHNIYIKHKYFIKKNSYSMEEEDLFIADLTKDISNGFYVDVGCYHPLHLNNTYLLYKRKWNGINIDISEFSIKLFNFIRPDDININIAVTNKEEELQFYYQKKLSQLSTIKKDLSNERMQGKIKQKKIQSLKLNTILNKSKYKNKKIDFLNIDIEGADLEALQSIDFKIYQPKIICVEIMDKDISESLIYKFLTNLHYEKVWSSKSGFNHIFLH